MSEKITKDNLAREVAKAAVSAVVKELPNEAMQASRCPKLHESLAHGCPLCKGNSFVVMTHDFYAIPTMDSTAAVPLLMVVCERCFNTLFFPAKYLTEVNRPLTQKPTTVVNVA